MEHRDDSSLRISSKRYPSTRISVPAEKCNMTAGHRARLSRSSGPPAIGFASIGSENETSYISILMSTRLATTVRICLKDRVFGRHLSHYI